MASKVPMSAARRFPAELRSLARLRAYLRESAEALGVDEDSITDLLLAADELATNAIVHGYQDKGGGWLEVEVAAEGPDLVVHLRDAAPAFDPTQLPAPDLSLPLEKRPLGGLGVYLARAAVDEMIYHAPPAGGNQLTLVKRGILSLQEEDR